MRANRLGLTRWLPVLAWMLVIFVASSDPWSGERVSRIIGPILRWLCPGIADATVYQVQMAVRKVAHLTEYGLLAVLSLRALHPLDLRQVPRRTWLVALVGCAAYAVSDELHQLFVPTRVCSAWDVLLDTLGAAAGLEVWRWNLRHRKADAERPLDALAPPLG